MKFTQKLEDGSLKPELHLVVPFPDVIHLGKTWKCSRANWSLLIDRCRSTLNMLYALRNKNNQLKKLLTLECVRNKDRMAVDPIIRITRQPVLDALQAVVSMVHTVIPEKLRMWDSNKPGMYPHPVAITGGELGHLLVIDFDIEKKTSRLLDARQHSPGDVTVIKEDLEVVHSVAYTDGVAFMPDINSRKLCYHAKKRDIRLRPQIMKRTELQQALAARNLSLNGTVPVLTERLTEALARADRSDVGHRDKSAVKLDKPLKRPSVVCSLGSGFLLVCDDQAKEVIRIHLTFDGRGISGETHTLCMYPVGCVRASDMSAAQDVIYFCFSGENGGIYKLNTNDDASLTSVFLNSQECTVVGIYADKESLYFNDACSRKVKRLDVLTEDISIIAGCGSAGSSDGKASESSFTQLQAIWGGEVLFVTDAATGSVHMITPLAGTVAFLRNLGLLFDSFGVHLKGQKPPAVSIRDAVSTLSIIVQFVEDCTMQVQKITRKKSPTNGPEGIISRRTQISTVMILHGLTRLGSLLHEISPAFGQEVGLQSCMTSAVENLHAVTKMKYPTPTVLDHARSFGSAMHESIKRMCAWSVKYYTPTQHHTILCQLLP